MRLILIVAAILVGMYSVDKFLAIQEREELLADARRLYRQGRQSMSAGRAHEAAARFRHAHALERSNSDYQVALASAELADHDIEGARQTLNEVLELDSNDARANLLMARAMAATQKLADADSFYHRAIYGTWPAHSNPQAPAVRLELAGLLAKAGKQAELLSELLLIQNETGTDKNRLAALFLEAGSATRAIDVYRAILRERPEDADAYAGLARAEMERGEYGAARTALRAALRIRPGDAPLGAQEEMVERLANLDPTPRRLSTAEKYNRSNEVLSMVTNELRACVPASDAASAPVVPRPKAITNELSESILAEAQQLWGSRDASCKQPPESLDPLPLLMKKLSL